MIITAMNKEISEGSPILYGGENDERHTRHAFVLDGYSEEGLYHINWGWRGENNGYFKLTDFSYPGGNYRLEHSMVRGIRPIAEASDFIPAISVSRAFRTNEQEYKREAGVEIWFMEDFQNVSLTDFWILHGVKCIPADVSPEFYISCDNEQWYSPRAVNRFYTISADKFPVGIYDIYPVFKTDTSEWMPCYQDMTKKGKGVRLEVDEAYINSKAASIHELRLDNDDKTIYYDLLGNKVTTPRNGIFIKVADGKASKIAL